MSTSEASLWIALLTKSQLSRPVAKDVLYRWCVEGNQPLSALYDANPSEVAAALGLDEAQAGALWAARGAAPPLEAELAACARRGTQVLLRSDIAYPDTLAEGLAEAMLPYYLYARGSLMLSTEPAVAVLGSAQPSAAALAVAGELGGALASQGRHLVGGYTRGVDRGAVDAALAAAAAPAADGEERAAGGAVVVLPLGLHRFEKPMRALQGAIDAERLLLLSPFSPDTPYAEALARARTRIVVAMSDLVILIEPPAAEQFPGLVDAMREGKRVLVWLDRAGQSHVPWAEAGAETFTATEDVLGKAESDVEAIDLSVSVADGADAPDAPPMTFDDATAAIETLSSTGGLPEALARRLREQGWTDS